MEVYAQISVIVPVYNAGQHLDRCIKSILCQSFVDFELLLIDDGSSDDSASICDNYASKDNRIRVFHQSNAGVSAARNLGLKEMCGKYLAFVDADDYVSPYYLADLYAGLRLDRGSGLIIQSLVQVTPDGEELSKKKAGDAFVESIDFGMAICNYRLYEQGYIASKLYDVKLIRKYGLFFDERIKVLEDLFFMYQYMLHCDYLVLSNTSNYIYVRYPVSGCRTLHPFDSVYTGFCFYQELVARLTAKWEFPQKEECRGLYASVMLGFDWSLKTDYWQRHNVSRKKRVSHLCLLVSNNYRMMCDYYQPVYKLDKIGKLLLKSHLYGLYDCYMIFLIKMNITSFLHAPHS
ncbi:MAG: glycosyltransferase [Parabacteroides johnsonii]|nr:glycosyltransferase [Parabacteroides johnsonii]